MRAVAASGLLAEFADAEMITLAGAHVARTLMTLGAETDERVGLAIALVVRAMEAGSVCLPLASASVQLLPPDDAEPCELTWPDPQQWLDAVAASSLCTVGAEGELNARPLRLVGGQLYLERNWCNEESVRRRLIRRGSQPAPDVANLTEALDTAGCTGTLRQAVTRVVSSWTSVIAGGPGTGKTTAITAVLEVLNRITDRKLRVALGSFTGKATARIQDSVDSDSHDWPNLEVDRASTIHSLLGSVPLAGFRHNSQNPLGYDVIIIDEMSMVSLPLMAALLEATRDDTRLVLVGDPNQLVSIEAGAVLDDIVRAGLPAKESAITVLTHNYRSSKDIAALAAAISEARSDDTVALLTSGSPELEFIDTDPNPAELSAIPGLADAIADQAAALQHAALAGDPATALRELDAHRLLCAHREGRYGVSGWTSACTRLIRSRAPQLSQDHLYPGMPVLITVNARDIGVSNGDTGVVMGDAKLAIGTPRDPRLLALSLVPEPRLMHALTIHKSQGSEYDEVTVILPQSSAILTRQLLYTAVTRAKSKVRIVGRRESIIEAINTPVQRATGLAERLNPRGSEGGHQSRR